MDSHSTFSTPSPDDVPSFWPSSNYPLGLPAPSDGSDEVPEARHAAEKAPSIPVDIDPDYYLESVFVVFRVENCLFRVPTYLFAKESQFFDGMFGLPQPRGDDVEGSSSTNPIVMPPEYKREDFRNLMKALYPRSVSLTLSLSKAEWISILKLSTVWYFLNLRKLAIAELERTAVLTNVDKIALGRRYSVSPWVLAGLRGLVQKDNTIADDEIAEIGYATAVKLFRLRELRLKGLAAQSSGFGYASDPLWTQEEAFSAEVEEAFPAEVEEAFSAEIASLRADEDAFKLPDEKLPSEKPASAMGRRRPRRGI